MKADTHVYEIKSGDRNLRDRIATVLLLLVVCWASYVGYRNRVAQKAAEAAQAKADKEALRAELTITSSPYASLMTTDQGWIVQSNLAAELLLGYQHKEMIGKSALDFVPEDHLEKVTREMGNAVTKMKTYEGNWFLLDRDVHVSVVHKNGEQIKVVVSVRIIKFMDEIQFIVGMRADNPAQQPIPPQKPVPLPEIPRGNAAIDRAINQMALESRGKD